MTSSATINDHLLPLWQDEALTTPAYVYDETSIVDKLDSLKKVGEECGCHILYSVKAQSFTGLLDTIVKYVDGFSVSSAFECHLAREILGDKGSIHMTSPGIRQTEMDTIIDLCDYISFNSISQWQRYKNTVTSLNAGLRINPELSFVDDERYNPCRKSSKLGITLSGISGLLEQKNITRDINGIHIHNNCESENFHELSQTVNHVCEVLGDFVAELEWINLGGGYLFDMASQLEPLSTIVSKLKQKYGLDVFFEPGKTVVGKAGYLVASVIDMFNSGDKLVTVLDTSINHLPEVFEYQYKPQVMQTVPSGTYKYQLAGASCLSGDLFGDYCFDEELQIGNRIIFNNIGAYMSVKANMFNGINLPTVYTLTREGILQLQKEFNYMHYRDRL